MAVDKLVDSAKLDACLDAEADAIRAKTGGSADIPFDYANNKGFADAIASIPGGGGSLPSVISKIDGGSFTPVSDQQASAYNIPHSLGIVPKGFVIWTEDEISGTIATRYMANCYVASTNILASNSDNYVAVGAAGMFYNGSASVLASNTLFTNATVANFMDSTSIRWNNTLLFYKAGVTYKWLAWA